MVALFLNLANIGITPDFLSQPNTTYNSLLPSESILKYLGLYLILKYLYRDISLSWMRNKQIK